MTFREFCLRAMAYERLSVQPWHVARFLALKVIEPHLKKDSRITVFDILPLPGDPTKEEIKEQSKKSMKSSIDGFHKRKAKYIEMGLMKELPHASNIPTTT